MRNFRILRRGFASPKMPPEAVFLGVFVSCVQLKQHSFGRQKSFWELVDIARMCLLYVSFVGDVRLGATTPE